MTLRRASDYKSPVWDSATPTQRAHTTALLAFVFWFIGGAVTLLFLSSFDRTDRPWMAEALLLFLLVYAITLLLIPYKVWRASYAKGCKVMERERNDPPLPGVQILKESGRESGKYKSLPLDDLEPRTSLIVLTVVTMIFAGVYGALFYNGAPIFSTPGFVALILFLVMIPLVVSSAIHTFHHKRPDVSITPASPTPGDTVTVRITGRGRKPIAHLDVALVCRQYSPQAEGYSYRLIQSEGLVHLQQLASAPGKLLVEFAFPLPPDWPWQQKQEGGSYNVCELRVDQQFGSYSFQRLYYRLELVHG